MTSKDPTETRKLNLTDMKEAITEIDKNASPIPTPKEKEFTDSPDEEQLDMAEVKEAITEIDKSTSMTQSSAKPTSSSSPREDLPSVSRSAGNNLSSNKESISSSFSTGNSTKNSSASLGGQRPVSNPVKAGNWPSEKIKYINVAYSQDDEKSKARSKFGKDSRTGGSSTTSTRKILPARSNKTKPLKRKRSVSRSAIDRQTIELYEKNVYNDCYYDNTPKEEKKKKKKKKKETKEPWHPDATGPVSRKNFRRYQLLVETQIRRLRLERDEYRKMWNREKSRADSGLKRFRETRERIRKEVEADYDEFNRKLRAKRTEPQWPPPGGDMSKAACWLYDNFEDQMRQHLVTVKLVAAENELLIDKDDEAEKLVLEALEVAKTLDYPPLEAKCKYWLGRIEYYRGNDEKALRYFMEARPCVGKYQEGVELQLYLSLFQPGLTKADRERILLNHDRALVAAHEKELRDRKKKKEEEANKQKTDNNPAVQEKSSTKETPKEKAGAHSSSKTAETDPENYQFVIDPRKLPIDVNARGVKRKMDDRPENLIFRKAWIRPRKKAVRDVTKLRPTLWRTTDYEPPTKAPRARTAHRGRKYHRILPYPSSIHALPPEANAKNSTGFTATGRYSELSWLFASLNYSSSASNSNSNSKFKSSNRPRPHPRQCAFTFEKHLTGPAKRPRRCDIWPLQWSELPYPVEVWESYQHSKPVMTMKILEREMNQYRTKAAPFIKHHKECERLRYLVRALFPKPEKFWSKKARESLAMLSKKGLMTLLQDIFRWNSKFGGIRGPVKWRTTKEGDNGEADDTGTQACSAGKDNRKE